MDKQNKKFQGFTLTPQVVEEFKEYAKRKGSNASYEVERLMRIELAKTNEELYACSWEELILHVKKCYAVIEEQRETIQGWQNDFQ